MNSHAGNNIYTKYTPTKNKNPKLNKTKPKNREENIQYIKKAEPGDEICRNEKKEENRKSLISGTNNVLCGMCALARDVQTEKPRRISDTLIELK